MRPDTGQVCHWLITVSYCTPGSAQRHAASAISFMSWRAGIGSPIGSPVTRAIEVPVLVVLDGAHELVGDPHRVVGVLVLDREEALAVDRHVKAGIAQRGGLVLLPGLAPDEVTDVGVVDVEHDHLGRAARLAARLDRPGPRVGAAHEAHRPGRGAALGQRLHRAADLREVDARPGPAAEDLALLGVPARIDSISSSTERMKQAEHCGLSSKPDVEPDRRVERRELVQKDVGQLGLEGVGVLVGGEVAALATPRGDRSRRRGRSSA